ncbi:MAG: TlpA family protein disulfide reductase [Candidatus Heimdallarchaeota archaeon]
MKMHKKISIILLLIISGTIITSMIIANGQTDHSITHQLESNLKPPGTLGMDWSLEDVLTDTIITFSNYEGKVVVLDFWATWCGPCAESIAELIDVKNEFSSSKVVIISINVKSSDTETIIEDYASEHNMNWKIVRDTENIADFYGVISIPTFYIFDKELKVYKTYEGVIGSSSMIRTINEILEEPATPTNTNNGEPISEFWAKNWYWFVILGIFLIICAAIFIQRQRVIKQNKELQRQKFEEKKRRTRKRKIHK